MSDRKEDIILVKVAQLASEDIPKSKLEYCNRIYEAFNLGQERIKVKQEEVNVGQR